MRILSRTWRREFLQRSGVLGAFLPRVRPHAGALAAAAALGVVVALAEVLKPWPLQVVFDAVLTPEHAKRLTGPTSSVTSWAAAQPVGLIVPLVALALVVVSALAGLAAYAQTLLLSEVGQSVVARLRRDLFRKLLMLSPTFHSGRRQGDLLMRLTGDIVLLRELLVGSLTEGATAALTLVGTLVVMLWIDVPLTLISLAIVPLVAFAGAAVSRRIRTVVRKNREKEGVLSATTGEALGAVAMLQAFSAVSAASGAFERGNRSSLRAGLKASRYEALLTRTLELLTTAGTGVTLAYGVWAVRAGELTPGTLLVFLAYQRTLYRPVRQLARLAARAAKSAACGERVLELMQAPVELADAPDARECPGVSGELELEAVSVRFPRGDRALERVSLRVPAGAVVTIRGESGAGKSTLLSLFARLIDPTEGSVRMDGVDIRRWTLASLRRQVAMVFQDSALLGLTVRENIALGDPDATEAQVLSAAEQAGVLRFAHELPQGLDTRVGERGGQLSGGQRQRIALARAALRQAPILVLDEPFAHLDDVNRDHVLAALLRVARGRTVVIVTHQDHPGLTPDFEFVLASGRLVHATDRWSAAASAGVGA